MAHAGRAMAAALAVGLVLPAAGKQAAAQTVAGEDLIGSAIFAADWVPAPDVSDGADGLGPLFSAASCAGCHGAGPVKGVAGATGGEVRRVVRVIGADGRGDPRYGRQIQEKGVAGHAGEASVTIDWAPSDVVLGDGRTVRLRRPKVGLSDMAYGVLSDGRALEVLRVPPLEGLGLLAAIAHEDIVALADPDDRDGDGIAGRVGLAASGADGDPGIGRFGWKAGAATLAAQTADAFNLDMGLSSPLRPDPWGDCTVVQIQCRQAADGRSEVKGGHEVSAREIELVVAYLRGLAPDVARSPKGNEAERGAGGRAVFDALACGACHRPWFVTGEVADAPQLSRQVIAPYSDLLVHDMGEGLAADGLGHVKAARSWRTAPLWGLSQRLSDIAQGRIDGLLHDGRARTIEEAILWHGGEAVRAREGYRLLPQGERDALIDYLAGL